MQTSDANGRGGFGSRVRVGALILACASCAGLAALLTFRGRSPDAPPPDPGGAGASVWDELRPPIRLPPGEGAWLLLSVVGGGFDGKGLGVLAANSSGDVVAAPPFSPPKADFPCRSRLADAELQKLASLVSSSRGRGWDGRYVHPQNPDGCCDDYGYALELRRREPGGGEQIYASSWDGGAGYLLPRDLRALQDAADSLKARALKGCGHDPAAR